MKSLWMPLPPRQPALILTFDLWPPKSNRVISKGKWLFTVSFIETAQVLHEIWCSQDSKRPAVTLTFDLQNLIRSSVGTSEYCLSVSSRLLKPFMRYSGIKICPDKWTAQKHNVINIIGWQSHKNHARKIRRGTSKPRFIWKMIISHHFSISKQWRDFEKNEPQICNKMWCYC